MNHTSMFPGLWTPTGPSILSKPWGVDCVALFCMVMTLFFHLQSHTSNYTIKTSQIVDRLALLERGVASDKSRFIERISIIEGKLQRMAQ